MKIDFRESTRLPIDKLYMVYSIIMHKVLQTETYRKWFKKLRDEKAKFAIGQRIGRMADGDFGDSKTFLS